MMARWMTRWKPSVGWVSTSSVPPTVGVFFDELRQALAQVIDIGSAGAQHLGGAGVVQQRQQQVLHGDELVPLLPSLHKRHVQADLKLLRNHAASIECIEGVARPPGSGQHQFHLRGRNVFGIDPTDPRPRGGF